MVVIDKGAVRASECLHSAVLASIRSTGPVLLRPAFDTETAMKITAVTGFYDVGRAGYDNRSVEKYISWLNQTLQTPLPFLVFLDPAFDASGVVLKPGDRIDRVAKNDLTMFGHRARIEEIVATSQTVNRRDISFHVAEYGIIVMSKLELMKRAASQTDADYLLWIDAGHCRMIPDLARLIHRFELSVARGAVL
ncbi:MAG: WlaTC/HtrL family glycosyltransferase, partial [Devosia sp.]